MPYSMRFSQIQIEVQHDWLTPGPAVLQECARNVSCLVFCLACLAVMCALQWEAIRRAAGMGCSYMAIRVHASGS
jgi:hypothetical protein